MGFLDYIFQQQQQSPVSMAIDPELYNFHPDKSGAAKAQAAMDALGSTSNPSPLMQQQTSAISTALNNEYVSPSAQDPYADFNDYQSFYSGW